MTLHNEAHDMSPPEHVPHGAPSVTDADVAALRKHAAALPRPRPARGPVANLISLVKKRDRYTASAAALDDPIRDAVHAARVDDASWEAIGHILGVSKDTARRTYQSSSVEAGGPERRVQRCGLQHATAGGWCRNGVAAMVERVGVGVGMHVCRTHGEELVASGKYAWRVKSDPLPAAAQ